MKLSWLPCLAVLMNQGSLGASSSGEDAKGESDLHTLYDYGSGMDNVERETAAVAEGEYHFSNTNCALPLPIAECLDFATSVGRDLKTISMRGSSRPKGCFLNSASSSYVFFNPGGNEYREYSSTLTAVCSSEFYKQPTSCVGEEATLSKSECEDFAAAIQRQMGGGYPHWGTNGNNRPEGCFLDSNYPQHVFYNPGGKEYRNSSKVINAVCKSRIYPSRQNCVEANNLSLDECEFLAESNDKKMGGGYPNWGSNGNDRPKGCFIDSGLPSYVFYNPGGDGYTGFAGHILAMCLSMKEPEDKCEDFAVSVIDETLNHADALTDAEIMSSVCSSGERRALSTEFDTVRESTDPCLQKLYQETIRNSPEALQSPESYQKCYEEVSRELEVAHEMLDRRKLAARNGDHRELGWFLGPVAVYVAGKLAALSVHATFSVKRSKRRQLRSREDMEDVFDFTSSDDTFVLPSSINNTTCNLAEYETALIMTPGPHFVLGARPLEAKEHCPTVAFDSHNAYETKTMFVLGNDKEWGSFSNDPVFSLGSVKLKKVFEAFNTTEPLKQSAFHVEKKNCFHFVQDMWRHLSLPENEELFEFLVTNIVSDENIGEMLKGVGSTVDSRTINASDEEGLKGYISQVVSRELDFSGNHVNPSPSK